MLYFDCPRFGDGILRPAGTVVSKHPAKVHSLLPSEQLLQGIVSVTNVSLVYQHTSFIDLRFQVPHISTGCFEEEEWTKRKPHFRNGCEFLLVKSWAVLADSTSRIVLG
ncbi:hypothetical protein GOP47_0003273 [Adiantum capillus-veneris]|uniref:Uncharacterized protein n=1 Tax=Adiantum capillus-veneris TaxID=13818 RepID=A0A9D4ZSD5_ADICA|nr:hypothetical protein GOP47_0003273 [Adiantum capillus-veneris]